MKVFTTTKVIQQNQITWGIGMEKSKQITPICEIMPIFAVGLPVNPRHFELKKRFAFTCYRKRRNFS